MLKELKLHNIKSFAEATVPMSNFTVLLGANASGKSNVRDVMRFLHGIGQGYRLIEIFDAKYDGGIKSWSGIRGGPNEFIRSGSQAGVVEVGFSEDSLDYQITLVKQKDEPIKVFDEWLQDGNVDLYSTRAADGTHLEMRGQILRIYLRPGGNHRKGHIEDALQDQPVLSQVEGLITGRNGSRDLSAESIRAGVQRVATAFSSMRFLDLSPEAMREPNFKDARATLGDNGRYLSTVLQNLVQSKNRERDILEWIKVLTPMDVAAIDFEEDVRGRVSLVLIEHDTRRTSAESASDGTLRFLAYLALAFSTDTPTTCFVEEIDNGIHPARLKLLVELIESQTKQGNLQVVASSHSPALVNLLSDDALMGSLLVYRTEDSPTSKIMPLKDLPEFESIAKRRQPGVLMESGWFENTVEALDFVEDGTR